MEHRHYDGDRPGPHDDGFYDPLMNGSCRLQRKAPVTVRIWILMRCGRRRRNALRGAVRNN